MTTQITETGALADAERTELVGEIATLHHEVEVLRESFSDLERAAEDRGWISLSAGLDLQLSREGLGHIARNCRVMAIASPLIKRGVQLRIGYVWGQGVQVAARADDVNTVVQAFWDDPSNQAAFTSSQAQEENERVLATDGNFFLALFTDRATGRVQVRSTPFEEITDVIRNPEDRDDPWYYVRQWSMTVIEAGYTGGTRTRNQTRRELHPALGYRPRLRPKSINGIPVNWDAPILHVPVNRLDGQKWGVPDVYAALPWARAYEGFLTDWARLVKALSKFAWRLSGDRASKVARGAAALAGAHPAAGGRVGDDAIGSVAAYGPGATLEAIPKTGATIDAESGRPLASMVAAALGMPVTTLLADPGTTGARAVAETLDKPTVLEMGMRQKLWASVIATVSSYVVDQAVRAPGGPLSGTVTIDGYTGRETITLAGEVERTVEISFPDLNDLDPVALVQAIASADETGKMPPVTVLRLLLAALRVPDADEIVEAVTDDDDNWIGPDLQQAVDEARRARAGADAASDATYG